MTTAKLMLATILVATPWAGAWAQNEGLLAHADNLPWPRWQARLAVSGGTPLWRSELYGTDTYGLKSGSLGLMSDYFFARSASSDGSASGFRATGGLVVGQRTSLWMVSPAVSASPAFSLERRLGTDAADSSTLPYLGVGYSGLSGRNGWNFSADFGLVAVPGRNGVRFGRAFSSVQGAEDLARDLRLSPVLQVGVSYSF
ncbi:MAG: hypothetical protein KF788_02830 [Piscinibacter sp.]|nr:hypothetical protein [Piscinibacter sp.]